MFCRRCGLELPSDAVSCPECGEKTGLKKTELKMNMFCRRCGLELPSDAVSCPECGEKTGMDGNEILDKEKESRQTNSIAKGILIAAAIIFGLWLGISGLMKLSQALG